MSDVSRPPVEQLYRSIYLIRRFEETVASLYPSDAIKSPVHLSLGQESVAAGVCAALEDDDVIFPTYRCHAAYLAKADIYGLLPAFGELFGKGEGGHAGIASSCCGGKGGSMHLCLTSMGVMGASAIVGTNVPLAVGYAYKHRKTSVVTVAFLGDGAMEQGVVFEAMNFAALHSLPVIFVCENNGLAINTPRFRRQAAPILPKAAAMGVAARRCKDDDPRYVYGVARQIRASMLDKSQPYFLEVSTTRACPHVGVEGVTAVASTVQEDTLIDVIGSEDAYDIRKNVDLAIRDACDAAQSLLDPSPADLGTNVWNHPPTRTL